MVVKFIRKFIQITLVAVLVIGLYPIQPTASAAETVCDELYYDLNKILFYNPCEDTCDATGEAGTIKGVDNVEKIWNFFVAKELKPVAIAGIMGNFSQESTFDPAVKQNHTTKALPLEGDGKTGYGLAQWTYKSRQAGLFKKMAEAGLDKYLGEGWGASEANKKIPPEDLDKLIEVQLKYAWEGDSTTIKSLAPQLNALTSVDGEGGSAVIFHNAYEGSSDSALQIQERVDDAKTLLSRLGTSNTPGGGACAASVLGGVKTLEDAKVWAERYVSDTKKEYEGVLDVSGTEKTGGTNPMFVYNFGHKTPPPNKWCWLAADCGQCVAMSGWFITKMTSSGPFLNNHGGFIVDNYEKAGRSTGTEPRPFSVFSAKSSKYGHTGIVLGVLENGEVITAETNWDSDGSVGVWQGNIQKRYAGKDLKFAYFDDKLAGDAASLGGKAQ